MKTEIYEIVILLETCFCSRNIFNCIGYIQRIKTAEKNQHSCKNCSQYKVVHYSCDTNEKSLYGRLLLEAVFNDFGFSETDTVIVDPWITGIFTVRQFFPICCRKITGTG